LADRGRSPAVEQPPPAAPPPAGREQMFLRRDRATPCSPGPHRRVYPSATFGTGSSASKESVLFMPDGAAS
jgi:hypothetical protein